MNGLLVFLSKANMPTFHYFLSALWLLWYSDLLIYAIIDLLWWCRFFILKKELKKIKDAFHSVLHQLFYILK